MQNKDESNWPAVTKPTAPDGSCQFFVTRKKRFCRFKPGQGHQYCAEHAGLMGADLERKRVQCPYEPKHTCYEDKLKHHMKKCPSRPREMPPYHCAHINAGDDGGETLPEHKETVLTVPEEELKLIIEKVNRLYEEHIGVLEEEILSHDCLQGELDNPTYGTAALRHRKQQASLLGHMDKLGLLKDRMCYLEMGAGKGQLSHWLHEAVEQYKDNMFVLIDRSHVRNKMDNLHKEEEVMERIRIDIEHLRLGKVPTILKHDKPVMTFGKHLCGSATDLSLRCVCETLNCEEETQGEEGTQRKRLKSENRRELAGAVIALCCHHRCTWTPYVGKKFFHDCGMSARHFQILSSMSSWATCAWKGWSAKRKQGDQGSERGQESQRLADGDTVSAKGDSRLTNSMTDGDSKLVVAGGKLSDREADKTADLNVETVVRDNGVNGRTVMEQAELDGKRLDSDADKSTNVETVVGDNGVNGRTVVEQEELDGKRLDSDADKTKNAGEEVTASDKHVEQGVKQTDNQVEVEEEEDHKPDTTTVSSSPASVEQADNQVEVEVDDHKPDTTTVSSSINRSFSQAEREVIGRKCKRLIDQGRLLYLQEHGLKSSMKIYIEQFYTPENVVLLASS